MIAPDIQTALIVSALVLINLGLLFATLAAVAIYRRVARDLETVVENMGPKL